ncbi:MAG: 2-dehydro-3-deoxy-6-phosphogalactonate aldolase, partial [Comamonadaceae bacterium]
ACMPGVMTPSEAFAALAAGASGLKLFPSEMIPPAAVRAMRAVLPPEVLLLPVGGITPRTMADYREAGADGFGIGSALYKPGRPVADIAAAARRFVDAWAGTMRA